jgi:hypothetical protein
MPLEVLDEETEHQTGKRGKRAGPPPRSTPSLAAQILADANRIEYETDAAGRVIGVRRLSALDMFDITLLLGENATNQAALMQALNVCSVVEIDGDPVPRPGSQAQLRALMKRLDFHGMAAAGAAHGRFTQLPDSAIDAAKN